MWEAGAWAAIVMIVVVGGWARVACAQEPEEEPVAVPEQAVDAYLERLGLKRLLADVLERRLQATPKDLRVQQAERLGRLHVDLLGEATASKDREDWEARARALLAQVPEADSFDLRLSLNKAVYARAEEAAERQRLRLATAEEAADAERSFRSLVPQFQAIASKAHGRVEALERIEQTGEATEGALNELADARRQRSLAFYYAGWSNYYLAMLTRAEQPAADAGRCFGWLLNSAGGRPPSPERVPASMFQYDHVARAAIGCGLAAAIRNNDTEALRWLDAVEQAEQTSPAVREQILGRRLVVLGQAKRWADLEILVRRTRRADRRGGGKDLTPLPTVLARLLAVITLEADKRTAGPQIEEIAKVAMGDLVANKEVAQVLDLVGRYGTAPLGDSGFVPNYVRALRAYDAARRAHEASVGGAGSAASDEPATDSGLINQYRAAASMFEAASREPDAEQFAGERGRAETMHGRALYYAGDVMAAADTFVGAWKLFGPTPAGEEPLWLAVLALEKAGKGPGGSERIRGRLNETVTLFLRTYPGSERAPRLTLMLIATGSIGDDEAIRVLSGIGKDSPVYEAARRQVARILYSRFRAARGPERDFAGARFVAVGEEVLAADRRAAMEGTPEEAGQAVERVIVRARQLLDALLGVSAPDVARAETVLKILAGVAAYNNTDLGEHLPELAYREVQIATARGSDVRAEGAAARLYATADPGGAFQSAGERVMYRYYAGRYRPGLDGSAASLETARALIRHGVRVIDRVGADPERVKDPGVMGVYATVAGAGVDVFKRTGDATMRGLAIRLYTAVLGAQARTEVALRGLAEMSESAGDFATSAGCWRTLLEGSAASSEAWFEAKYHMIRLLARVDADKARSAMAEHKVLYPEGGPEPWGPKFRELDSTLGVGSPTPARGPSAGAPGPRTGGGGDGGGGP